MTSLRIALRLNAASCLAFGALFVASPQAVATYLGEMPSSVLQLIGVILLGNGAHLLIAAARQTLKSAEVVWFSLGDLLWGQLTAFLLAGEVWITTTAGQVAAGSVALSVSGLGLVQLWQLGQAKSQLDAGRYWQQIGQSWLAMPTWVKLWLFFLNGVFLFALAFDPFARTVVAAYVASGPVLLAIAFSQGGLTRATGLGHLIPWLPLMVWVSDWLWRGNGTAMQITYAVVLWSALLICLSFDIYDLRRWSKGERRIFGMKP